MLKYKFNKRYDTFFKRNELSIYLEYPYGGLRDVEEIGINETKYFINLVKKNIAEETPNFSNYYGLQQIGIFMGGKISKYGFNFDTEHYTEYEFPTIELLKLLEDWLVFQIENKD